MILAVLEPFLVFVGAFRAQMTEARKIGYTSEAQKNWLHFWSPKKKQLRLRPIELRILLVGGLFNRTTIPTLLGATERI